MRSMATNVPEPPEAIEPDAAWEHLDLYHSVRRALFALPSLFESDFEVTGVLATDLYSLSASLGATLEVQVVEGLNRIRNVWDPEEKYALYRFVRQPQTFPDVTLRASSPELDPQVLMGIELKGWYALAKEREPTFRFKVTPAVCQPQDLLVVYPWALTQVLSGSPRLFEPWVVSARYAAAYRNWYWEHGRETSDDPGIAISAVTAAYPVKSDQISDSAHYDAGGNFGRVGRYGIMNTYIVVLFEQRLAGIPLSAWQRFFRLFSQDWTEDRVIRALDRMAAEADVAGGPIPLETLRAASAKLAELGALLEEE
jgi:hypothetical protein